MLLLGCSFVNLSFCSDKAYVAVSGASSLAGGAMAYAAASHVNQHLGLVKPLYRALLHGSMQYAFLRFGEMLGENAYLKSPSALNVRSDYFIPYCNTLAGRCMPFMQACSAMYMRGKADHAAWIVPACVALGTIPQLFQEGSPTLYQPRATLRQYLLEKCKKLGRNVENVLALVAYMALGCFGR